MIPKQTNATVETPVKKTAAVSTKTVTTVNTTQNKSQDANASNSLGFVFIALCVLLLIWLAPAVSFTEEFKSDLMEKHTSYGNVNLEDYFEEYSEYLQASPNVYNLIFGGKKEIKFDYVYGTKTVEIDYGDLTLAALQWVFAFHIMSIIVCFLAWISNVKILKTLFVTLVGLTGILFFVCATNTFSQLISLLNLGEKMSSKNYLGLGFGCWGSMVLFIVCFVLGIKSFDCKSE